MNNENNNFILRKNHFANGDIPFVTISTILFLIPGAIYTIVFVREPSFIQNLISAPLSVFISWGIVACLSEVYVLLRGNYYIRPINKTEYQELMDKKLIHYTNKTISTDFNAEIEREYKQVRIVGKLSAASNYVMKRREKRNRYVWFHQEEILGTNEPNIKSYLFSHGHETEPRKFKVILDPQN